MSCPSLPWMTRILGLEVAVHDAQLVRLGQCVATPDDDGRHLAPRQRPVAAQDAPQILAAYVLHDEIQRAVGHAEVEGLHGVRWVSFEPPRPRGESAS